jgi:hypothetical protein
MRPHAETRSSYSHAMKMRAAMTYGFGRLNSRGTRPWHITDAGKWEGNPSISDQVSRYMVSLRRRKVDFFYTFLGDTLQAHELYLGSQWRNSDEFQGDHPRNFEGHVRLEPLTGELGHQAVRTAAKVRPGTGS